jgi:hypothetical protein
MPFHHEVGPHLLGRSRDLHLARQALAGVRFLPADPVPPRKPPAVVESILDQVGAFGEGPLTAARVREVLGLIPDDVYGELLRLIAARDAAAVFRLVGRLFEAGADLEEFIGGAETCCAPCCSRVWAGVPGAHRGLQAVVQGAPPTTAGRRSAAARRAGAGRAADQAGGNPRLAVEVLHSAG